MRALVQRVVANQHRNDAALGLYERREHRMVWDSEERRKVEEDKLYRVVPTGTGTIKLLLADRGKAPSPAEYRKQLLYLQQALVWALDPHESKQKQRVQKWEKKEKERRETVEAVLSAFHFKWLGRETRDGRGLVKLRFEPAPGYEPTSRATDMLAHSVADVWIEPDAAQLVRVEAQLARDFNIAAGILGKVYKGGAFTMEQAPVAEGVWLPVEMRYDFKGRKFVFGFDLHEQIRSSQYHRIGPPAQALAAVRRELTGPRASR
ncbi:MAG: hypothetical protein ACRD5F_08240 [Candidatus Acidiferrales bacterium]